MLVLERPRTSRTLPRVPPKPEGIADEAYTELRMARIRAHRDLLLAERAERAARNARSAANSSVQSFEALLEALHGTLFDE